ncbi:MAG: HAMP domain-containing histidine kinase [Actinomycetota bacterium]|nr:HAMP domain-containing histidine kinase [Actinomycetota bacterium]
MTQAVPPLLESGDGPATSTPWELIAGASHDLRNPICSIGLMIDAVADGLVDDATARRYFEQIRKQLSSMTALADDLIMVSRLNSGHLPPSTQIVNVNDLINDALDVMDLVAGQSGVELIAEVSPSVGFVRADADRLLRVLLNLIANAIRHSPRCGTVLVTATGRGQMLSLEVRDSGPGIPPEQQEEIFKPFVSGQARGTRAGHAGLGLAICQTIIERHGGRIWIGPSPRGARFCVEIPTGEPPRGPFPLAVAHLKPAVAPPLTVPATAAARRAADG